MRSLTFVMMFIVAAIFVQTSLAQAVPREISDEDKPKIVGVEKVRPLISEPLVWQTRSFEVPRLETGRSFNQPRFGAPSSDSIVSLGPLRLVSRSVARAPGQDVYYPAWERPKLTFWGIFPTLSVRKDRYTKQYGFRAGIQIRF